MVPRFALPEQAMSTAGVPPSELFLTVEPANYPEDVQATRGHSRNCRIRSNQQESTVGLLPDAEGESHWGAPEQKCGEPMSCQIGRTASNKKSPQPPEGDCGQLLNYRAHQMWNDGVLPIILIETAVCISFWPIDGPEGHIVFCNWLDRNRNPRWPPRNLTGHFKTIGNSPRFGTIPGANIDPRNFERFQLNAITSKFWLFF